MVYGTWQQVLGVCRGTWWDDIFLCRWALWALSLNSGRTRGQVLCPAVQLGAHTALSHGCSCSECCAHLLSCSRSSLASRSTYPALGKQRTVHAIPKASSTCPTLSCFKYAGKSQTKAVVQSLGTKKQDLLLWHGLKSAVFYDCFFHKGFSKGLSHF